MAGVVAMASVIEDFDTQPCKKSCKDGGNPVVKTITNYFSPVPKPVEKPFSPPRSNNIMDYFSRRSLPSKEKTSSPEQSKENCQKSPSVEKHISPEAAVKQPTRKRGRKGTKAARKLVETESGKSSEDGSCFVVEDLHSNRDSLAQTTSSCGVFGSDTAALLAQLNSDTCVATGTTETATKVEHQEDCPKSEDCLEPKPLSASSPVVPSKEKSKQMRSTRKGRHQELKRSVPEEEETMAVNNSLCDLSMEVNVDEASQLNRSTVISFEDFVRSQSQDEGEAVADNALCKGDDGKISNNAEGMDVDRLGVQKDGDHVASGEQLLQVSPRTVTIQAEVHAVSPKQEALKPVGKVASIFKKRKGSVCLSEMSPSPHIESENHAAHSPLTAKRRSNVVLQEEDLELDVIEVESTVKSSDAERKQFMAAFKQPATDASKSKLGKNQGKQKPAGEKVMEAVDKLEDAATQEPKVVPKKPGRRCRKKSEVEKDLVVSETPVEASPTPPFEESPSADPEVEDNKEEAPSTPVVRRSRREAVVRQTSATSTTAPVRDVRKQERSKDDTASTPDTRETISTPKTRRSKHGVYVAEMVAPPDIKESPIRIKFTRVHKDAPKTESSINSPLASKVSNDKKRKKAKKLVEKAKAIQQGNKATAEVKSTLRRSSRAEASITKSYCEDEDSIICVEEDKSTAMPVVPEKKKAQKSLRSLNDVLGKAKNPAASKFPPVGQEKNGRRASSVVSIFDESSHEGSENSQDDEQFRARREFLKSGLPDSFRKQIAKAAAIKEAITISSHCFQPVIHATQPETDCPLWGLPWPGSTSLLHLKEVWSQPPSQPLSVSCSFDVKKEPAPHRRLCEKGSGWRPEISEQVRQLLMEEISSSNPTFPSQMFITRFLARRAEHHQYCPASDGAIRVTSSSPPAEPAGGKRKRVDDEGGKVAKKHRATKSDESKSVPAEMEPPKRGGRTRRSQRGQLEEEAPKAKPSAAGDEDNCIILLDEEDSGRKDETKEDALWTDKYQPQHSTDLIGNKASVRRLHSWLKEWKLRADREERNKQKDKKQEEASNDSDWDLGEDGEDSLCNTILITGPTGVGKTAAVYACAQELGFKVFEVNASSLRSGRLILSQLKEATQSHQVDSQGVNAHKPTYFNSYGASSSAATVKPGVSPRKINSPRRVVSSPGKHPQSPRGAKRGSLAPTALANFFKMGRPTNKEPVAAKKEEKKAASKNMKGNEAATVDVPTKLAAATTPKENNEEQGKKSPTSLILFEEVDVIFDEDSGFLAAIKTFMMTTKRPVILTTSDPAFSTMFDGNFEEIHFKSPSLLNMSSYLRLICLAEDMRTDQDDVMSLLRLNGCDIRLSLLQLQYWMRSAGGRHITRALQLNGQDGLKPKSHEGSADTNTVLLPPCDTSCTESVLGLLNVEPEKDIWELFQNQSDNVECWDLLKESNRWGVHLLYSNMEALLPLPTTQLTSTHRPERSLSASQDLPSANPSACPQSDTLPSCLRLLPSSESADCSDDGSPVKVSHRMKTSKRQHRHSDMDALNLDSDSEDGFLSLSKPRAAPQAKEETKEILVSAKAKRKPLTPDERAKSLPVSQTLESIADFFNNMSDMDSSLHLHRGGANHGRNLPASAVVKDGMTDEPRVESNRLSWVRGEQELEIKTAVEALSFHRCRLTVAEAWDGAQQLEGEVARLAVEELSLPVASHRQGYSFTQDGPCEPQLVQRRSDILESLMFRGVSGTLGNRSLVALDYLPALRAICRSEQLKEQCKVKRRFLHYLDSIHLGLEKGTLQHLAEEFP